MVLSAVTIFSKKRNHSTKYIPCEALLVFSQWQALQQPRKPYATLCVCTYQHVFWLTICRQNEKGAVHWLAPTQAVDFLFNLQLWGAKMYNSWLACSRQVPRVERNAGYLMLFHTCSWHQIAFPEIWQLCCRICTTKRRHHHGKRQVLSELVIHIYFVREVPKKVINSHDIFSQNNTAVYARQTAHECLVSAYEWPKCHGIHNAQKSGNN